MPTCQPNFEPDCLEQEHKHELKRFEGMDLVFEARMRFLEMPWPHLFGLQPKLAYRFRQFREPIH